MPCSADGPARDWNCRTVNSAVDAVLNPVMLVLVNPIGQSQARKSELAQRIARKQSEAVAVLHVILNRVGVQLDLVSQGQGSLLRLIEIITAGRIW